MSQNRCLLMRLLGLGPLGLGLGLGHFVFLGLIFAAGGFGVTHDGS